MKKWSCPSCGRVRATPYCPTCGEEPLRERDLSLQDLIGQFARALSSIDGRLARSFRTLLTRPGALTEAHVGGRRRAYLGPLPLFLLANALFFAVQSITHFQIFSSPLESHLHHRIGALWRGSWWRHGWRIADSRLRPMRRSSITPHC